MGKVTATKMNVVTNKSGHDNSAVFPNVCRTPGAKSDPVAIPYPQIEQITKASNEAKKVKADASALQASRGGQPGAAKGVVTQHNMSNLQFLRQSARVRFQGKSVAAPLTPVQHNHTNVPGKTLVPSQAKVILLSESVDYLLTDYRQKVSQPSVYTHEQALRIQARFEQELETLLSQLLAAVAGNPGLQGTVQRLAMLARAAAKGQ